MGMIVHLYAHFFTRGVQINMLTLSLVHTRMQEHEGTSFHTYTLTHRRMSRPSHMC